MGVCMTAGMRGGGFAAGGVGGLALALLLVGVASYLPQVPTASQVMFQPEKNSAAGGASSSTLATTAMALSMSTTKSSSAASTATVGGAQDAGNPPSAAPGKTNI